MKKLLISAVLVVSSIFLTSCEDEFKVNCETRYNGHVESDSQSDYKYGYNVTTGKYEFHFVTTTTRKCFDADHNLKDIQVS